MADQQHQGGADQQLVGDRIEHAAEFGLLAAGASQVAVEPVGDGGGAEQDAGGQIGSRMPERNQDAPAAGLPRCATRSGGSEGRSACAASLLRCGAMRERAHDGICVAGRALRRAWRAANWPPWGVLGGAPGGWMFGERSVIPVRIKNDSSPARTASCRRKDCRGEGWDRHPRLFLLARSSALACAQLGRGWRATGLRRCGFRPP